MGSSRRGLSIVPALLVSIASGILSASDDLSSWPDRPVAYFLTSAEREHWPSLKNHEERSEFTRTYFESRGKGFEEALLSRIALADTLFTLSSHRGSETIRGKILIVLGPPTRIERLQLPLHGYPGTAEVAGVYTSVGPLGTGALSMRDRRVLYRFSYKQGELSWVDGLRQPLEIEVAVDLRTGRETLGPTMSGSDLQRILALVAEASKRR